MVEGFFFKQLIQERKDSLELISCMKSAVQNLLSMETTIRKPGMLLGKIQSGKTRAFIGIIALAFDNDYDVVLVLTKGTKALTKQTLQRLEEDFKCFIEEDQLKVFNIMNFPNNLTEYELSQKIVIVAKKEVNNMSRVIKNLVNIYPDLRSRKILIIDDEADYASISFKKRRGESVEFGKIMLQIDELRRLVADTDYLQVTATPYSLYLQPDINEENFEFSPRKPMFTALVPIHSEYIGGDFYFLEAEKENSIAYYILEEVPPEERETLKKPDRRRFRVEDVLTDSNVSMLRKAIINFITGANIRRLQQQKKEERIKKYSFVAHSEISKQSHKWQCEIIKELVSELKRIAVKNKPQLDKFIRFAYRDLNKSLKISDSVVPAFENVREAVYNSIRKGHIMTTVVNSERDTEELLDRNGQLHLRTPLNIFIGGQILDRGITIGNLIGFYYGRKPQRFQQDTVLQHSRMYGTRDKNDLAVTRFYTTMDIYNVMKKIHEFDTALREAFERGDQQNGVYFIRVDISGHLAPCSPNKLLLSSLTALRPYKRMLPIGFQTDCKTRIEKKVKETDSIIANWFSKTNIREAEMVDFKDALHVVDIISETLIFDESAYSWNWKGFKASLEHLSKNSTNELQRGKVFIVIRTNSDLSRRKSDGRFTDDVGSGTGEVALTVAKRVAIDIPALMLVRLNGADTKGWRGTPFWWPVLLTPKKTKVTIFANDTII